MPAIRRVGYQGTRIRQLAPDVFADNQPLGSDRLPHLESSIPAGSITADKLAPGVIPGTNGAPATVALVSGTGLLVDATSNRSLSVPIATTGAASVVEAVSPDNITYYTLVTHVYPTGITFGIKVFVPRGWYVKITAANATIGTGTYY